MRVIEGRSALVSGLVLVLLAGCSGDADPQRRTTDAASATPTPASPTATAGATATAAVVPSPPPATDDRAGQVAFAEYVLEAWVHALNTNDADALLALGGRRPCEGCGELADELATRAEDGWYVALDGVRAGDPRVTSEGPLRRVQLSVSVPESASYHTDGRFRSANPAHPDRTFEVVVRLVRDAFRLISFSMY